MNSKIIALAAATLAITAGAASAQVANTSRQAGAAPFDQGGVFYQEPVAVSAPSVHYTDRTTTSSIGGVAEVRSAVNNPTGVPSDTRNERGLGLFDRVSK